MTTKWKVSEEEVGRRLDRAVAARLGASNNEGKRLVEEGSVLLDGVECRRASSRVAAGSTIEVDGPVVVTGAADPQSGAVVPSAEWSASTSVLYRDEWLIALNKPAGLPTHATHDPDRDHARAAVLRLVGPDGYAGVHHRLDVTTSGVLLFTTAREANKGVADAFSERRVRKTYLAVTTPVAGDVAGNRWEVEDHLATDKSTGTSRSVAVRSGGKRAQTAFRIEAMSGGLLLVEARPRTGRMHQIRTHLASGGRAIVGDELYGGVTSWGGREVARAMLHAARLELEHPVTGASLRIEAPLPEDMASLLGSVGLGRED